MPYMNKNVVLNVKMDKILLNFGSTVNKLFVQRSKVRIYKSKQENTLSTKKVIKKKEKKERKHALDQESEKEKQKNFLFFLIIFLVESMFSFFA